MFPAACGRGKRALVAEVLHFNVWISLTDYMSAVIRCVEVEPVPVRPPLNADKANSQVFHSMSKDLSHIEGKAAKRLIFRIISVILGLCAAIVIVELGVRLFSLGYLPSGSNERELFCRFDRELGWAPLENATGIFSSHGHSALVHQNKYGMRDDDVQTASPSDGRRRILVLGDSFAWGFGVGQNELFSSPEVHDPGLEILNFGVSGYGTDQEYLLYLKEGTRFAVDQVVLMFTPYNDVANNLATEQYGYFKPCFKLQGGEMVLHNDHVRERKSHTVSGWLSRHSRTWNLLGDGARIVRVMLEQRKNRKGTANARMEVYRPGSISKRDRDGVDLTVAILKKQQEAVLAQHAQFTVVFLPFKPHVEHGVPENHPLVPLLAEKLSQADISNLDSYPAFLAAAQAGAHLFNEPDGHLSPEGHVLMAKILRDLSGSHVSHN